MFGRHISRRADGGNLGAIVLVVDGGAEIGNLDLRIRRQQQVGRLDVAVRKADAVGKGEGPGAFENELDNAVDRKQMAKGGMFFQRPASDVFHDDVAELFGNHRVVNLGDVRVPELADQRGFVEKKMGVKLARFRVAEGFRRGDLDRHLTLGEGVATEINGTGGAFAELL